LSDLPAVAEPMALQTQDDRLMEKVLDSGNIEILERFIALREKEESRQAKLAFDRHFAEMQSEFVAVKRDKKGYDYKYAPVESLQKAYGPIISKHGFSYRWREESIENGKRCIMTISGWGCWIENYFDIPMIPGTKQMNAIQVAGAMSTYGRRYTFISGFGVIIEDEDSDGVTFDDGVKYSQHIQLIEESSSLDESKTNASIAWKSAAGDFKAKKIFQEAHDKRKRELSGGAK